MKKIFGEMGVRFPPEPDPATGRFILNSREEDIRQSIYLILMTMKGERIQRPEFGSQLNRYVFEPMDLTSITMMENEICHTIESQEPRVDSVTADVTPDEKNGKLVITLRYAAVETGIMDSLDIPFYNHSDGGA